MKTKGFSLIELMIVVAMVGIVATVIFNVINGSASSTSWGVNGVVETRCINGLQFVVGQNGQSTQVYDTLGHGVACDKPVSPRFSQ